MENCYRYEDRHPTVDPTAYIAPGARLVGDVRVGACASVWFNAVLRGDIHYVAVGRKTNIQDGAILHVTHEDPCTVGDEVTVGHGAILHGCAVEDGCLIGMGAVVLSGARVGRGSVVGAGAVVPEGMAIPPRSVVLGVPGRVVRTLETDAGRELAEGYVVEAERYRRETGPQGNRFR